MYSIRRTTGTDVLGILYTQSHNTPRISPKGDRHREAGISMLTKVAEIEAIVPGGLDHD
jgi:hypothetical protein